MYCQQIVSDVRKRLKKLVRSQWSIPQLEPETKWGVENERTVPHLTERLQLSPNPMLRDGQRTKSNNPCSASILYKRSWTAIIYRLGNALYDAA